VLFPEGIDADLMMKIEKNSLRILFKLKKKKCFKIFFQNFSFISTYLIAKKKQLFFYLGHNNYRNLFDTSYF